MYGLWESWALNWQLVVVPQMGGGVVIVTMLLKFWSVCALNLHLDSQEQLDIP